MGFLDKNTGGYIGSPSFYNLGGIHKLDSLGICTNSLGLYLDAGQKSSYPGNGTTWYDLSGNGRHATLVNNPTYSICNSGAIELSSANEHIQVSNSGIAPTGDFTYSCWISFDSLNKFATIFENGLYSGGILIRQESNGITIYSASTLQGTFAFIPEIDKWYYLNFIRSGNTLSLYVNGSLHSSFAFSVAITYSTTLLFMGKSQHSQLDQMLMGQYAIVEIYTKALTLAEIKQNYNANKDRFRKVTNIFLNESNQGQIAISNWVAGNLTLYNMTDCGFCGDTICHGWNGAAGNYILSLSSLPTHTKIRYRIHWHMVDSLDTETSYMYMTNNSSVEENLVTFTRAYNVTTGPTYSVVASGVTTRWSGTRVYSYTPWTGTSYDGFAVIDSGWRNHTLSTCTIRHYLGADQAATDEAMYLSHAKVWIQ